MLYNLLYYIQTIFNQRLIYLVAKNTPDSTQLTKLGDWSQYIPLFIWLPFIYFCNDEYIYKEYDKYYFVERDKKISISPPIDKIKIYNNKLFGKYDEVDISYVNQIYSHNIPFWIICHLENLKDKIFIYNATIVIEKMDLLTNHIIELEYQDIYMKNLYQIFSM